MVGATLLVMEAIFTQIGLTILFLLPFAVLVSIFILAITVIRDDDIWK
jgi:hypothetical protein